MLTSGLTCLDPTLSPDNAPSLDSIRYLLRSFQQFFDAERLEQIAVTRAVEGFSLTMIAGDQYHATAALRCLPRERNAVLRAGKPNVDDDNVELISVESGLHLF